MKNILPFLVLFFAFQLKLNAQTPDYQYNTEEFSITKCVDMISGSETYSGSKNVWALDKTIPVTNDSKGFNIRVSFTKDKKTGEVRYGGLTVVSFNIGQCVEKGSLDFVMESGIKVRTLAYNDFNCDGYSFLDYAAAIGLKKGMYDIWNAISAEPVKIIRFTNGRDGDFYTYTLTDEEGKYFMEAKEALMKPIAIKDCTK